MKPTIIVFDEASDMTPEMWEIGKRKSNMIIETYLRGVSFRPIEAKSFVNLCEEGTELKLEREPYNKYDPNAIKVLNVEGLHLGYVAKEDAVDLAPRLDDGEEYTCKFLYPGKVPIIEIDLDSVETEDADSEWERDRDRDASGE